MVLLIVANASRRFVLRLECAMDNLKIVIITLTLIGASLLRADELIHLRGDFRAQVRQIMERRQLNSEHYEAIYKTVDDIQEVLRGRWPDAKLTLFGSVVTGLATPYSDIDCYVDHVHRPARNTTLVEEAESILKQYPELFTDINISGNRIPIVNAVHLPSQRKIDLSFTGPSAIKNSQLLKYLYHTSSTVLEFAVIVQYWARVHQLDHFTRYTSRLIMVFFLQQKGILPPVAELQKNVEPLLIDHWNTAFQERFSFSHDVELFELLGDFFGYVTIFNYDRDVISPFVGYPVNKAKFQNITRLPEEFSLYKYNVGSNITGPMNLNSPVIVQEFFDHNQNVADNMDVILAKKMIATFRTAHDVYRANKDPDEFLKTILQE